MRHRIGFLVASAAIALISPASALGAAGTSPDHIEFGNQQVGSTSPPRTTRLSVDCVTFVPLVPLCTSAVTDSFTVLPSATGDFSVVPDPAEPCGQTLDPTVTPSVSCVIDVVFTPSQPGPRTGTLSTGFFPLSANGMPSSGPAVSLSGTGIQPGGVSAGGGGAGPSGRGDDQKDGDGSGGGAAKKPCKKGKKKGAASARKRCKKQHP